MREIGLCEPQKKRRLERTEDGGRSPNASRYVLGIDFGKEEAKGGPKAIFDAKGPLFNEEMGNVQRGEG